MLLPFTKRWLVWKEKKDKEVRVRQLEVTFRAKDIHLNVEELEAVQTYLKLTDAVNPVYVPSTVQS